MLVNLIHGPHVLTSPSLATCGGHGRPLVAKHGPWACVYAAARWQRARDGS